MDAGSLIPLLGLGATTVAGLHMAARPFAYLGTGNPPARDPRTVRQFGVFVGLLGVFGLSLFAAGALLGGRA